MAQQLLLWTVLPFGQVSDGSVHDGMWRISAVVSPRLTPENAGEQTLASFPEWLDWPKTLGTAKIGLRVGTVAVKLTRLSAPDSALWQKLFSTVTPVAGFQYQDMSQANLHSFPLRNVLAYARKHYGQLAVQSASTHPTLLPWDQAHPDLRNMLEDIGTRTTKIMFSHGEIEVPLPGFSRFFQNDIEKALQGLVFGPDSVYRMPVPSPHAEEGRKPAVAKQAHRRAMPPDWVNPRPGGPGSPLSSAPDAMVMDQFSSADEYAFYQADRFYRRKRPTADEAKMRYPDFQNIPARPKPPEFDFHRILASYADYPELLRALGLVVDFAIEDSSVIDDRINAGGGTAVGQIQLKVGWDSSAPGTDARPSTAWLAREKRFVPRPLGQDQEAGLLRLEHSDDGWNAHKDEERGLFDLYQVDPDGTAIKTVNFTLTAQNLLGKSLNPERKDGAVTYTTGNRQPVAALRSAGLGVSQHGRAENLAQIAAAADLKNQEIAAGNAQDVVLFAEDVQRGFRVDIAEVPDLLHPGDWRSLCARDGSYELIKAAETLMVPPDEGYVSGASTTSDELGEHYLHESLFRWTGWSLVAPRPGLTIKAETNDEDHLQAEVPSTVTDTAKNGSGVAASFRVPKGSLPRLRFGRLYRVRARTVDLAGNSLAVDDPSLKPLEQASDAVGYWRFEPVDPPAMVQRNQVSEGESLERMVIRSNVDIHPNTGVITDITAENYLNTPDWLAASGTLASADFEYHAVNERHLVPPKSSQQQCETHGFFDKYFGDWTKVKQGYEVAAREDGSLYDKLPGAQVELITPAAAGKMATTSTVPPALPDATNPVGDRMAGGQYIVHREAHVKTPYLADGAAGGIAIRAAAGHSLPGVDGVMSLGPGCEVIESENNHLVIRIDRGDIWPDCDGFRLILAERGNAQYSGLPCDAAYPDKGAPEWDANLRTLTFQVEKGQVVRLLYSSFIHEDHILDFGIPRWAKSDQEAGYIIKTAMAGTNWLMTPYRKLTLVHAVQQPVCPPVLELMSPNRGLGEHDVKLLCRKVHLHGPSSGKFEIEAEWHEWVDDIQKAGPERKLFRGQLGEIRLAENHRNLFNLGAVVDAQLADPEAARGDVHELGDTRFRLVKYRARATTRFREYLPPPFHDDIDKISRLGPVAEGPAVALPADDDPGAPVLRDPTGTTGQSLVMASAAPKDPRLLYVVPTFRWSDRTAQGPHNVTRTGNGLRIWLDRPWFSSGDGELLGVVIFGDGQRFTDIPRAMQPLVTQWGMDPLWDTSLPKTMTRDTDFSARITADWVRLQERPNDNAVRIIGHRVHWDKIRGLWYCDIELDPGTSYMPFVRPALVRYQPNAHPLARISKVVQADFSQVLPRRRLRVSRNQNKISVSLHGPNPAAGPMHYTLDSAFQNLSFTNGPFDTGRNRVEVVLQEQDPGIESDLGWKDIKVLSERVVGEEADTGGGPIFTLPGIGRRVVRRRAGGTATLPGSIDLGLVVRPDISLRDPAFWSDEVTLPSAGGKRRIAVREFERFYSDNTANQRIGTGTFPRRIIEERLVFADFVDPETL